MRRRRGQRVDRRVQTLRRDLARELGRRVQVGERRGRRRVGVVVGRDVDRLQRRDRVTTRRGDALLEKTHLVGQVRLVAHCGRHAPEQRGDLGTGLREAEDVVDEEQHVLLLHVTEVLRHRQRGECDAQTRARRLVHLAEDECRLVEDARLLHLDDQVVALTRALPDTGEHRDTTVVLRDTLDHLLDEDGLADARTTEEADLPTLHVRRQQVDRLDAGLEHVGLRLELVECRRLAVDGPALGDLELLALREVEHLAGHVEHVALGDVADGDADRRTRVGDDSAADQAVGRLEGDRADERVTQVLCDLEGQSEGLLPLALTGQVDVDGQRVVDLGDGVGRELDVDDGADHAGDTAHAGSALVLDLGFHGGGGHYWPRFAGPESAPAGSVQVMEINVFVMRYLTTPPGRRHPRRSR